MYCNVYAAVCMQQGSHSEVCQQGGCGLDHGGSAREMHSSAWEWAIPYRGTDGKIVINSG